MQNLVPTGSHNRPNSREDEFMQTLREQMDQVTHYDQWMRAPKTKIPFGLREKTSNSSAKERARHYMDRAKLKQLELARDRIKMLEIRLATQCNSLRIQQEREINLISKNEALVEEIELREEKTSSVVNGYLTKYAKCRIGGHNLGKLFDSQKIESADHLNNLKASLSSKISVMEKWIEDYDTIVKTQQKHIYDLQCYKDKQYHVKSMQISELEKKVAKIDHFNEINHGELEQVMEKELKNFADGLHKKTIAAYIMSSEVIMKYAPNGLPELERQNLRMTKEVGHHEKHHVELEKKIIELEKEVDLLNKCSETKAKGFVLFKRPVLKEKCAPDMDMILDIPMQKWLPI